MGTIHLLEDSVINKIAAGEVVERPASIVKELLENALDSGAKRIIVDLLEGGRKKIAVTDNGSGMSEDDARLSVVRHATSKIKSVEDLFAAPHLGFRGEALASISAVSRFSLSTRLQSSGSNPKASSKGTKILMGGDAKPEVESVVGIPPGTSVVVEDLFFNVPARLQFLKSTSAEYTACFEVVEAYALAHPEIEFVVKHNQREVLNCPAVLSGESDSSAMEEATLRSRAKMVLGAEVDELQYVKKDSPRGSIAALVSPPGVQKGSGKSIFTFVNGRLVKDRALRYAVMRGFQSHLMQGKYPIFIGFLEMDPSLVDVNVHPAKTEVRLQYAQDVQNLLTFAIRDAVRGGEWARPPQPSSLGQGLGVSVGSLGGGEAFASFSASPSAFPSGKSLAENHTPSRNYSNQVRTIRESFNLHPKGSSMEDRSFGASGFDEFGGMPKQLSSTPVSDSVIPWEELRFIGSFGKCYLLFEHQDNMLSIDQHAFHERIIFERLKNDPSLLAQSQQLLVPDVIEFEGDVIDELKNRALDFRRMGFDYHILNGYTIEVLGVPMILAGKDLTLIFSELLTAGKNGGKETSVHAISDDILATMACHSAVRAGELLGENDLRHLLGEATKVDFYLNCPHGRRVLRWWTRDQIARWFDR